MRAGLSREFCYLSSDLLGITKESINKILTHSSLIKMKLALYLLIVLVASCIEEIVSDCQNVMEEDKTCGLEITYFGNRNLVVPLDADHYKQNCGIYEDGLKCLDTYLDNCLEGQTQAFGKTILASVSSHYQKRCKDDAFRAEFIEHNKCFADKGVLEEFHRCADIWFHRMDQIKNVPRERHVQASCCIFHELQECIREKNKKLCHDKTAEFWDNALDEMSDDSVDLFCHETKSVDECNKNFPRDLWSSIHDKVAAMSPEDLAKRNKFQSYIFEILDMASGYKL